MDFPAPDDEFARLVGVRSSKGSYYREYRRSTEGLDRTIRALEVASRALTRLDAGPRRLVEEALVAVVRLLDADGAAVWPRHPAFPAPHDAAYADVAGQIGWCGHDAPEVASLVQRRTAAPPPAADPAVRWSRRAVATRIDDGFVLAVPLLWSGRRDGRLVVLWRREHDLGDTDVAIMASVANQLAASVQASWLLAESARLHEQATRAYEELSERAAELGRSNQLLRAARSALLAARTSQMVAEERQRIARELHDTVAQRVLTLGMQVEWARGEVADPALAERLAQTKQLARETVQEIREAIFQLSTVARGPRVDLPAQLREVVEEHRADGLVVTLRTAGQPVDLPVSIERDLVMIAREALFNILTHAQASRAVVRLSFARSTVRLSVLDDGIGDAAELRRHLADSRRVLRSGYHRGLAFLHHRVQALGGRLTISPSRMGGVRISVVVSTAEWS